MNKKIGKKNKEKVERNELYLDCKENSRID